MCATPGVLLIINRFSRLALVWRVGAGIALATVGLSLYDVLGRRAYAAFMATSAMTVCALVIVLTLWRLRRTGVA